VKRGGRVGRLLWARLGWGWVVVEQRCCCWAARGRVLVPVLDGRTVDPAHLAFGLLLVVCAEMLPRVWLGWSQQLAGFQQPPPVVVFFPVQGPRRSLLDLLEVLGADSGMACLVPLVVAHQGWLALSGALVGFDLEVAGLQSFYPILRPRTDRFFP
jgi:hypothetical protein